MLKKETIKRILEMINWLMTRTYKQTALLMSGFLSISLILGGLAMVAFGNPHPSVTYWDAVLYPLGVFILSMVVFALIPIIWSPSDDAKTE